MTLIKCSRCLELVPVAVHMYTEASMFRLQEEKWCVNCFRAYCEMEAEKQEMQEEMK